MNMLSLLLINVRSRSAQLTGCIYINNEMPERKLFGPMVGGNSLWHG